MSVDVTPLQNNYLHCAYCSYETSPDTCRHCKHYPYYKRTKASNSTEVFQKSWVSVKDRLPEPNSFCLTWAPEAGVEVLKYQCFSRNKGLLGFWRIEEGGCRYVEPGAVTHWMPLPKPPSE